MRPTLSHLQLFALRKAAKHADGFAAIGKNTARTLVKLGLAELCVPHTPEGLAVIQITQLGLIQSMTPTGSLPADQTQPKDK